MPTTPGNTLLKFNGREFPFLYKLNLFPSFLMPLTRAESERPGSVIQAFHFSSPNFNSPSGGLRHNSAPVSISVTDNIEKSLDSTLHLKSWKGEGSTY